MNKIKLTSVLLLILLGIAIVGCQPTPKNTAAVSEVEETTSFGKINSKTSESIPTRFDSEYSEDYLSLSFAADIVANDVANARVYRTTNSMITDSDLPRYINGIFKDSDVNSLIQPMNKAQYESFYLDLVKTLDEIKNDAGSSGDIPAMEAEIERVSQRMNEAPETVSTIVDPYAFYSTSGIMAIKNSGDLGRKEKATLSISIAEDDVAFRLVNGPKYTDVSVSFEQLIYSTPHNVEITKDDALQEAEKFLSDISINDMQVNAYTVGVVSKNGLHDDIDDFIQQCHMFFFTRVIEGIPITYTEFDSHAIPDDESFNRIPSSEYIIIAVDDEGVALFDWRGMTDVADVQQHEVDLVAFDDVVNSATQHMKNKFAMNENKEKYTVEISRVVFGYMNVLQKNNNDYNLLIPVWDFFGTVNIGGSASAKEYAGYDSVVTVNALNGSIIDRNLGY